MQKAQSIEKEFGELGTFVGQLDSIGKLYPNSKTVSEDKEFEKACLKEIGLPEDFSL
jgi:hypothetical protein